MIQTGMELSSRAVRIRTGETGDVSRIGEIVQSTGNFNEVEERTAIELVNEFLTKGPSSGYLVSVLDSDDGVQGYVCYGPTPLTEGVYDLYWIAVHSDSQGNGYGKLLLRYVENDVFERDGRMLVIETSSQEKYVATIRFYESEGYEQVARVRDFYRIGDDKLIFVKDLR